MKFESTIKYNLALLLKSSYLVLPKHSSGAFQKYFFNEPILQIAWYSHFGATDSLLSFRSSDKKEERFLPKKNQINRHKETNLDIMFGSVSKISVSWPIQAGLINLWRDQIQNKRKASMQKYSTLFSRKKPTQISKQLAKYCKCPVTT